MLYFSTGIGGIVHTSLHPTLTQVAEPITQSMFGSKELTAIVDSMVDTLDMFVPLLHTRDGQQAR